MDVFKAFTTLSLVDMISRPLRGIRGALQAVDAATVGLGGRMGRLAVQMAPLAIASGVILGAFGACAGKAMAMENAMSGVARVVKFETRAELEAMTSTIKDLSGQIGRAHV